MTIQAIGRGVRRVKGNLEVKVEIMDAITQRSMGFETYTGPTLEDVTSQVQTALDQRTLAAEDRTLSKAVVGMLLAASATATPEPVAAVDAEAEPVDIAPAPEVKP